MSNCFIRKLNFVLSIYGQQLCSPKLFFYRYIIRILYLAISGYTIVHSALTSTKFNTGTVITPVYHAICTLMYVKFWYDSAKITDFCFTIDALVTNSDKRLLCKYQTKIITCIAIQFLLEILSNMVFNYVDDEYAYNVYGFKITSESTTVYKWSTKLIVAIVNPIIGAIWSLSLMGVYILMLNCIDKAHHRFFIESVKQINIARIRLDWQQIVEVRESFECLFSLYPLVWFANMFFRSVIYLISTSKESQNWNINTVVVWYWFVIQLIHSFSILYVSHTVNSNSNRSFKQFCRDTTSKEGNDFKQKWEIEILKQEIRNDLDLKLTAFNLFDINSKLLLSFISALITFSVLFLQLYN